MREFFWILLGSDISVDFQSKQNLQNSAPKALQSSNKITSNVLMTIK